MNLQKLWWILGVLLIGLVVLICLLPGRDLPNTPLNDKLNHVIAHFILAAWFAGLVPRRRWWKIFVGLLALGIGIEVMQGMMHVGRESDPLDVAANSIGAAVGLAISWLGLARWPELVSRLLGRAA
jgi:VanZ family protein